MTALCVRLGNGRQIPLGAYVTGYQTARSNLDASFKHGLCGWWPVTGAEIVQEYKAGMMDRLTRHLPWYGKGRKWEWNYQRGVRNVADRIHNRIIVRERECPKELRSRLSHRLYRDDDF